MSNYIKNVLEYIENNLSEDINPPQTAEVSFVSLSRLYRDFYCFTGHSIKEYIRKRRISNACEKIKNSDIPLSVIADESGCETQQSFHKQFKSIVGMTPLEYRQRDTYYYFYPHTINEISLAVKVSSESIPNCKTIRFYDSCLKGIEDRAIDSIGGVCGRVFGRNGKQIGNRFCYEVMTQQEGEGKTDLYAVCTVNYNEKDINDGWDYLYNIWLSSSMFEESDGGYFEEYIFTNSKPRKLKLYLPVKKRKAERHIVMEALPQRAFVTAVCYGQNAERRASEKVVEYMREHYPLIIQNASSYYVRAFENGWECGVECGLSFTLPKNSGLEVKTLPEGRYALLYDDCLGDMRVGRAKMELWLKNNGYSTENQPVFAVYETKNGNENIKMKICKLLKI